MILYTRIILAAALLIGALAIGFRFTSKPRSAGSQKQISTPQDIPEIRTNMADIQTKDCPEQGVHLIGPSNPSFAKLAQLVTSDELSGTAVPPVFLQNTSKHSIVGYRITWACIDRAGITDVRDKSNIISYVFLHGDESERIQAMAGDGVLWSPTRPGLFHSVPDATCSRYWCRTRMDAWLIHHPQRSPGKIFRFTDFSGWRLFDDGTFVGPDTTGFFNEAEYEIDARYEILNQVGEDLKSGVRVEDVFTKLEQIAGQVMPELPELPSRAEYLNFFRGIFAKNILGMKHLYGTERAIEDVHQQLSKPLGEATKAMTRIRKENCIWEINFD
jgi:hypothetical protein